MSKTVYDIFISYRRDGGGATAGRINDMLAADGYSVSYDVDTLREGRFDKQLLERIEQCQDFILVVDKNCFVRTIEPSTDKQDDWLWQELSYALLLKKNIIPVILAGADFPKRLPEDIDSVRRINGPKCVHEYFDEFYKRLRDDFLRAYPRLSKPSNVGQPFPTKNMACLKLKADIDCIFYLDGEERSHLKAGVIQKFPLAKGEYELMFVSEENEADSYELEFVMPDVDKFQKVNLSDIRNARLQKEAEAKRIAEEKRQAEEKRKKEEAEVRERKLAEERRKAEEQRLAEERRREAERKAEQERKRREEEERAKERTFTAGGVPFKMIRVKGGSFMMGSLDNDSDAYKDEKPQHRVTLNDFYIGETQVTQALWKAVMGNNPSRFKGENLPVECVSWNDICGADGKGTDPNCFLYKLNRETGKKFRLPTEAEWEYAACGRKNSDNKYSGSNTLGNVAWYSENSGSKTHPVKQKSANELGLYDMSGNVWEWCQDWFGNYSGSSQTNPLGPSSGSGRVLRGGGWFNYARGCRVAFRDDGSPDDRNGDIGFRLALVQQ